MQVQQALKNHFGQSLPVTLVNHPPPPTQALLAQLVLLTQFVLAAVVLSGPQAAPYLARIGIVLPPETWQAVQEKKVGILMGAWFIGNTVRQNLLGTGAFEVSYDGTPIFSKLDTGRMPTLPELVAGIAEAMAAAGNPAGSGTEQ